MLPGVCTVTELEVLLDIVGEAATRLKKRLDLICGQRIYDGKRFSGLHETVLPLCSKARSIFDQLRNTTLIGCTWVPLGLEVVSGRRQLYLAGLSGGAAILERRLAGACVQSGGGAGARRRTGPS